MKINSNRILIWASLALFWTSILPAATAVDVLRVDLNPLIDKAARTPEQFAVKIPHAISIATQGTWAQQGSTSTWTYTIRIPSAVSMSFHASEATLPRSAALTVTTGRTPFRYVARDVSRSGLWGRPLPGDTLTFSLTVNTSEAKLVRLQIESLQAGYRSLGPGVADHPHFAAIRKAAATSAAGCTENFTCHVTDANRGPAHATVAVLVSDLFQCSGTLLNNTRGDGLPYVLTARHCQGGALGGGNPNAAATVSVYWDAITPCGTALASIYDTATLAQTGATTALEQQDLWLIQLDAAPVATNAFYAGWDANGSAIAGGYTIHYALGQDQQYVEWHGTDLYEAIPGSTFNIAYDSTFWGVVNSVGSVSPGASGAALFSPGDLVVGSASLADLTADANQTGVCPAAVPPAATPNTVTALFTAISGAWTSSADRTSSTGSKTLKSLLDPMATGQLTLGGLTTQPITLAASQVAANSGDPVTLNWNIAGAQSCTAWGGVPGDGWAGARATSGALAITNQAGGTVNYSLNCLFSDHIGSASISIAWNDIQPLTNLAGEPSVPLVLGAQWQISWTANIAPCVASGGTPGDGWSGPQPTSGSYLVTATQMGMTLYTLNCGNGRRSATTSIHIFGIGPDIHLVSDVSTTTVDSPFFLSWSGAGYGGSCTSSGGSGNYPWASGNGSLGPSGSSLMHEPVAGTYTYTVTCTGGGQTVSDSRTVVVSADPPVLSIAAASPQQQVFPTFITSPVPLDLYWSKNGGSCEITYTPNGSTSAAEVLGYESSGAMYDIEHQTGRVTYTLQCGSATASTTIDWISAPVPNALSVADSTWAAGVAYPITWTSSVGPCVASGGHAGDGWAGSKSQAGTQNVTESQPGAYVFTLACGSGAGATTSQVITRVRTPFAQMLASPAYDQVTGLPVTRLSWQSSVGPCTYRDGSSANPVAVSVAPVGSADPAPAVAGTYVFTLTCGSGASVLRSIAVAYVGVMAPTTLVASATTVAVDTPVTLTWTSQDGICYASGGDGTAPWIGTLPGVGSGSLIVTSRHAGSITYAIGCGHTAAQVVVTYVGVPGTAGDAVKPTATLKASASTQNVNQSMTLTWSSTHADSCSATGGDQGDGWSGTIATSGSMSVTETTPGTVTYSITCAGAPPAAVASISVSIMSANPPPQSSSSGGGGSIDLMALLFLAAVAQASAIRRLRLPHSQVPTSQ